MVVMDVSLLLRAFSIFAIVASHFGLIHLTGGALYLIALSGFNFIKFTQPKLGFNSDRAETFNDLSFLKKYYRFVRKLAVPTVLYLIVLYLALGEFHFFGLFLISNFMGPNYAGGLSYWFIEVLLQIYVVFSIVLMIKPVRMAMTINSFKFFTFFSVISFAFAIACEWVYDSSHLLGRLPHLMLYIFSAGALVACSKTISQKILTSFIVTAMTADSLIHSFGDSQTVLFVGLMLTIWVPTISIPKIVSIPIKYMALSSLFIYLSHFQTRSLVRKFLEDPHPAISVTAAIIVGIAMASLWKRREDMLQASKTFFLWTRQKILFSKT